MKSVGRGKSTGGSRHITSVVDKKDSRPVWITVWGAPTDLAQALWDVSHSRRKDELDAFISRMRVYDIAGQDDCGGWGGRFNLAKTRNPPTINKRNTEAEKKYYDFQMHTGAKDAWRYKGNKYNSHYAGLFRWREPFQNDFAARMDWSLADSYEKANHNPVVAFESDKGREYVILKAKAGDTVKLSAAGTSDPDGDGLFYRWFHYGEAGDKPHQGKIAIKNANQANAKFVMPKLKADEEIHIILEVSDDGRPALYSYRRIVVRQ